VLKKTTNRVPLDNINYRTIVKFRSDNVEFGTPDYRFAQRQILSDLLGNPGLLECGNQPFEKLRMYHDGECWVVELEAVST
jgi:hypothetical protein